MLAGNRAHAKSRYQAVQIVWYRRENPWSLVGSHLGAQVHKHQMVVGAARNQLVAALVQFRSHGRRVVQHLLLVRLELGCGGLLESYSKARNGMVVGSTLVRQQRQLFAHIYRGT